MKRRSFLAVTTLASLGIATIFVGSCADAKQKNAGHSDATNASDDFELDEETISNLGEKLTSGKYTSVELVNLYLKRIESIDTNGAQLNAIIEINPEAVSIAKQMDDERKNGKIRGSASRHSHCNQRQY